ncbi:MAG: amidohydrolase family protein [Deltaproteobacteria bacterium]|nr:amidohydrolase family protein [Deltaproteobacteria bacterium]
MVEKVIVNALAVTPAGIVRGGIGIEQGKIVAIATDENLPKALETIDAGGRYVIPGVVDPHAHPGGKYPLDQDFRTETPGAAAGGVTTIGAIVRVPRMGQPFKEFPEPADVVSWLDVFDMGRGIGERHSLVDFFFTFTINSDQHAVEIPEYATRLGVTTFKFHGNLKQPLDNPVSPRWAARIGIPLPYDDSTIFQGFEQIGRLGGSGVAEVHCENTELTKIFKERLVREEKQGLRAWAERSPDFLEAEHIMRYAYFARVTRAPFYVLHLSSAEGVEACARLKDSHARIQVETCPHYLALTCEDVPPGLLAKVNPPVRFAQDNERLWEGLRNGTIDCIGSDHVVTSLHEKLVKGDTSDHVTDPATDIWATGSGFVGLDTLLPVMLSEGVNRRRISLERLVEVCCTNPAKLSGLYPRKGVISLGADADLVILDLEKTVRVSASVLHSYADFTVFDGRELRGWPVLTMLRGTVIMEDGKVTGRPGAGRYLPRSV